MKEAVLVVGGDGKRLGDAAKGKPKPLVPLNGRPLSSYMVEHLYRAGVARVVVNCASGRGELFAAELGGYGPEIVVAEEPDKLGRGGGLRYASRFLEGDGPFFVVYGDEIIDVDLAALVARHRDDSRGQALLTVTAAPLTTPFGVLEIDEAGRVEDFREGPTLEDHWVNVGVYLMEPEAVSLLPERGDAEQELFPRLAREGRLWAYRHAGVWLTVNTPKDLERAERYLKAHPGWPAVPDEPKRHRSLARDVGRALERLERAGPARGKLGAAPSHLRRDLEVEKV